MFLRFGAALDRWSAGLPHHLNFLFLQLVLGQALQFFGRNTGSRRTGGNGWSSSDRIRHPHHAIGGLLGFTFVRIIWRADFQPRLNERFGRTEERTAILAARQKAPGRQLAIHGRGAIHFVCRCVHSC